MRLIKQIPHPRYLIQVHSYNGKYLIKITLDEYEQIFKINEEIAPSIETIEKMIEIDILPNCLNRFIEMRSDLNQSLKKIKNENFMHPIF